MDNKEFQELIDIMHEIKKDLQELRLIVKEMFEKDEKETKEFDSIRYSFSEIFDKDNGI
jgi:hypothetical protein